jgi:phage shock protein C
MFCTQCGVELEAQDRYCCQCGRGTGVGSPWPGRVSQRRLTLDARNKKIAGVCAGFARYLDLDVTLVRIVWMILVFVPPGLGLIGYVLAWLVMPAENDVAKVTEPTTVPR